MDNLRATFTKRLGPLPVWVWGLAGLGILLGYWFLTKRGLFGASQPSASPQDSQSGGQDLPGTAASQLGALGALLGRVESDIAALGSLRSPTPTLTDSNPTPSAGAPASSPTTASAPIPAQSTPIFTPDLGARSLDYSSVASVAPDPVSAPQPTSVAPVAAVYSGPTAPLPTVPGVLEFNSPGEANSSSAFFQQAPGSAETQENVLSNQIFALQPPPPPSDTSGGGSGNFTP